MSIQPRRSGSKSGRSASRADCVEVVFPEDVVGVRNSKNPTGPTFALTPL
ncbi:DUF397 domain-containing protein [Nocardia sp. KC 131]